MEFREILRRRRMVRHYSRDPVDPAVVERVVATVRRAPSAGFSQGQRLLVVTDEQTRRELADVLGERDRLEEGLEPWLSTAPVHVLVCTREEDYHDRYRKPDKLTEAGAEIEWPVPYWFVDAGAAAMLLLLAAVEEGLAAGLTGIPAEATAAVKERLGIPADVTVVALVTIGRGVDDPGWSAATSRATQPRRALDELVHWERWGGRRA